MENTKDSNKDNNSSRKIPQNPISSLIDLFDAIDTHEKGIEKVYDYLLIHHSIEDPKSIFTKLQLSLKRIYKIFSVLKELGLVQIYSRPMKVTINPPMVSWENLLSKKIQELRAECSKKIELCETSFQSLVDDYDLHPKKTELAPVEFISVSATDDPIEFVHNLFQVESNLLFTKGMNLSTPFQEIVLKFFKKLIIKNSIQETGFVDIVSKWFDKRKKYNYNVLFSEEFINENHQILEEFSLDSSMGDIFLPDNINFEIKVIKKQLGNFVIKDHSQLYQFSLDPSNVLVGFFISKQKEITEVFEKKYQEFYQDATDLDKYFAKKFKKKITTFEKLILALI
jgi:hypothetical protein